MSDQPLLAAGIDPSTSYIGIGLVNDLPRLEDRVVSLLSCRIAKYGPHHENGVVELVWPVLRRGPQFSQALLFTERPPNKARADKKGAQAAIGQQQAWIGAWSVLADHSRYRGRVDVRDHRQHMQQLLRINGYPWELEKKVEASAGGGKLTRHVERAQKRAHLIVSYTCGHTREIPSSAINDVATTCLACLGDAGARSRVMDVREAWKRLACAGIKAICAGRDPNPYTVLVEDARSRAVVPTRPDHQLAGVSDACEAAWVALRGLDHHKNRSL